MSGVYLNFGESVTVVSELSAHVTNKRLIQSLHSIEFFQPGKGKGAVQRSYSDEELVPRTAMPQWLRTPCGKPGHEAPGNDQSRDDQHCWQTVLPGEPAHSAVCVWPGRLDQTHRIPGLPQRRDD